MDTQVRKTVEPVTIPEATPETRTGLGVVMGLLRLALGWTFLWAFLDKMFALGFSTGRIIERGHGRRSGSTSSVTPPGSTADRPRPACSASR